MPVINQVCGTTRKSEAQFKSDKLAVLIDANATASIIEALLKEVAKYGIAHVKRVCGD